jgi:hypothetical protein
MTALNTVKIAGSEAEFDPFVHIAGLQSTLTTLCGWVDVDTEPSTRPPNCPECLRVVAYCKSLQIRKSTLAKVEARS